FIERERQRCQALELIAAAHPDRDIRVIQGEANEVLRELVTHRPWTLKGRCNNRGIAFLDPYALQVDWETLCGLAATGIIDVWYRFPIRDTVRQLARNFSGIGPKEPMLDRVLGPQWRELYSIKPQHFPQDLFEAPVEPELQRVVSVAQFETWLK